MLVNGIECPGAVHDSENIKGFFGNYRWLSNFYEPAPVMFEGLLYPASECAYQAAKTTDVLERQRFTTMTSSKSKREGRLLKVRPDWDKVKFDIMYQICLDKFTRNEKLGDLLVETDDKFLEECNYWNDRIWGVCRGVGRNMLGRTLMRIREEIR